MEEMDQYLYRILNRWPGANNQEAAESLVSISSKTEGNHTGNPRNGKNNELK